MHCICKGSSRKFRLVKSAPAEEKCCSVEAEVAVKDKTTLANWLKQGNLFLVLFPPFERIYNDNICKERILGILFRNVIYKGDRGSGSCRIPFNDILSNFVHRRTGTVCVIRWRSSMIL